MPDVTRILRATAPLLVSCAMIACGESPEAGKAPAAAPQPESSPPPSDVATRTIADACALLTDEDIERATGYPVLGRKSFDGGGIAPGCNIDLKTGTVGHSLSFDVRTAGGRERFNFVTSSMTPIPGVGDAAAKLGGNINGTYWAVSGDTLVTMRYALPVKTDDPDPLVLPLVKAILSRT